jgi:hypothetical protein
MRANNKLPIRAILLTVLCTFFPFNQNKGLLGLIQALQASANGQTQFANADQKFSRLIDIPETLDSEKKLYLRYNNYNLNPKYPGYDSHLLKPVVITTWVKILGDPKGTYTIFSMTERRKFSKLEHYR